MIKVVLVFPGEKHVADHLTFKYSVCMKTTACVMLLLWHFIKVSC